DWMRALTAAAERGEPQRRETPPAQLRPVRLNRGDRAENGCQQQRLQLAAARHRAVQVLAQEGGAAADHETEHQTEHELQRLAAANRLQWQSGPVHDLDLSDLERRGDLRALGLLSQLLSHTLRRRQP